MTLKRCIRCEEFKPRAEFRRQTSGRLYRACSTCHRPHTAEGKRPRAYYKSPEYKRACRARKAHSEGREFRPGLPGKVPSPPLPLTPAEAARAAWREWIELAPQWWTERHAAAKQDARRVYDVERARAKYAADPAGERRRVRAYKHANPDAVARHGQRRWARAAAASDGTIKRQQADALLRSRKRCPYCFARITADDAELDHIIPLALGGLHGVVNIVPCCAPCNGRKGARAFVDWVAMLSTSGRQSAERLHLRRFGIPAGSALLL